MNTINSTIKAEYKPFVYDGRAVNESLQLISATTNAPILRSGCVLRACKSTDIQRYDRYETEYKTVITLCHVKNNNKWNFSFILQNLLQTHCFWQYYILFELPQTLPVQVENEQWIDQPSPECWMDCEPADQTPSLPCQPVCWKKIRSLYISDLKSYS